MQPFYVNGCFHQELNAELRRHVPESEKQKVCVLKVNIYDVAYSWQSQLSLSAGCYLIIPPAKESEKLLDFSNSLH